VLEPQDGVAAIGSGGNFALAAAMALYEYEEDAETIARKAMKIAADICVYTNGNLTVEKIENARFVDAFSGGAAPFGYAGGASPRQRLSEAGRSTARPNIRPT
jgi:hypothetical protein